MTQSQRTPAQIRQEGIHALLERLGAADTMRFFQQFESAREDYTRDRDQFLPDWPIDEMVREADRFAPPPSEVQS